MSHKIPTAYMCNYSRASEQHQLLRCVRRIKGHLGIYLGELGLRGAAAAALDVFRKLEVPAVSAEPVAYLQGPTADCSGDRGRPNLHWLPHTAPTAVCVARKLEVSAGRAVPIARLKVWAARASVGARRQGVGCRRCLGRLRCAAPSALGISGELEIRAAWTRPIAGLAARGRRGRSVAFRGFPSATTTALGVPCPLVAAATWADPISWPHGEATGEIPCRSARAVPTAIGWVPDLVAPFTSAVRRT